MSNMSLQNCAKIYELIRKVDGYEKLTLEQIGDKIGYQKTTISNVLCALRIKKKRVCPPRKIKIKAEKEVRYVRPEPDKCWCGECPPNRQSTECYSIEVAGRPLIDPSLDYLNSKSFC